MKPLPLVLLLLLPSSLLAGDKKLRPDDRVLLLGGGMIEQERLHGFIESRLIRHHPEGKLLFRNLGWGGDTVRGAARTGGFNNHCCKHQPLMQLPFSAVIGGIAAVKGIAS